MTDRCDRSDADETGYSEKHAALRNSGQCPHCAAAPAEHSSDLHERAELMLDHFCIDTGEEINRLIRDLDAALTSAENGILYSPMSTLGRWQARLAASEQRVRELEKAFYRIVYWGHTSEDDTQSSAFLEMLATAESALGLEYDDAEVRVAKAPRCPCRPQGGRGEVSWLHPTLVVADSWGLPNPPSDLESNVGMVWAALSRRVRPDDRSRDSEGLRRPDGTR